MMAPVVPTMMVVAMMAMPDVVVMATMVPSAAPPPTGGIGRCGSRSRNCAGLHAGGFRRCLVGGQNFRA